MALNNTWSIVRSVIILRSNSKDRCPYGSKCPKCGPQYRVNGKCPCNGVASDTIEAR